MASKNVFRATEIKNLPKVVFIEPPEPEEEVVEAEEAVEEYSGPTADDLRREADAFKASWEAEKSRMVEEAKAEADKIIKEAEDTAFTQVKEKQDQAQKITREAEDEAAQVQEEAKEKVGTLLRDAEKNKEQIEGDAYEKGFAKGEEEGYLAGNGEVERLIQQLHTIINSAFAKRNEIIEESETQIVNLVLAIAQKVIKVISENQKNVVVNNVIQALRKLKSRGDVVIRVNLEDVKLTTEHIKDFLRMVENVNSITVVEDSTVDRGGCVVETDFGEIDARISSQFREIEDKIVEIAPIQVKQEKV